MKETITREELKEMIMKELRHECIMNGRCHEDDDPKGHEMYLCRRLAIEELLYTWGLVSLSDEDSGKDYEEVQNLKKEWYTQGYMENE